MFRSKFRHIASYDVIWYISRRCSTTVQVVVKYHAFPSSNRNLHCKNQQASHVPATSFSVLASYSTNQVVNPAPAPAAIACCQGFLNIGNFLIAFTYNCTPSPKNAPVIAAETILFPLDRSVSLFYFCSIIPQYPFISIPKLCIVFLWVYVSKFPKLYFRAITI